MTYLSPILTVILALGVISLRLALTHRKHAALCTGSLAIVILFICSWPPMAQLWAWTLERGYEMEATPSSAEAIVVLSSSLYAPNPPRPFRLVGKETYVRCRAAAWLYHNAQQIPILVSGGRQGQTTVASEMATVLREAGVPADKIWTEDRSQDTHENALFSARELASRGVKKIILVTNATHMPRAERCFRRQGLTVVPAPCDFQSVGVEWRLAQFVPHPRALAISEDVLHEWIARSVYWLRGFL